MNRTDDQLVEELREAVSTIPLRASVPMDVVVTSGRRRVRNRRAAAGGSLLAALAVAGVLYTSLPGLGQVNGAPPAGRGGPAPSATLSPAPPESPTRLYDALDARLEVMGLTSADIGWSSGAMDPRNVVSAYNASGPSAGFLLETTRVATPNDLSVDACADYLTGARFALRGDTLVSVTAGDAPEHPPEPSALDCEQVRQPDGTQLIRVGFPADGLGDASLVSLTLLHEGGAVSIHPQLGWGEPAPELTELTEEQLTEIVTDPALRW